MTRVSAALAVSVIGLFLAMGCALRPAPNLAVTPATVLTHGGCPQSTEQRLKSAVRTNDALLRSLLIEGCRLSPTLRRVADEIGRTDGVVYLTPGECQIRALRACLLHTIVDTENARYLWIRLGANPDRRELVVSIAHELQHALEVLSQGGIRSKRDLLNWYRFGESQAYGITLASPFRSYETTAAIDVGDAVRSELADRSVAMTGGDHD